MALLCFGDPNAVRVETSLVDQNLECCRGRETISDAVGVAIRVAIQIEAGILRGDGQRSARRIPKMFSNPYRFQSVGRISTLAFASISACSLSRRAMIFVSEVDAALGGDSASEDSQPGSAPRGAPSSVIGRRPELAVEITQQRRQHRRISAANFRPTCRCQTAGSCKRAESSKRCSEAVRTDGNCSPDFEAV